MTLNEINALPSERAREVLERCCGSREWVHRMVLSRPFASPGDLYTRAESVWKALREEDWKEAFACHPRIGSLDSQQKQFSPTGSWEHGEQSGTASASEHTLRALASDNIEYERKFGYVFIVCATGKSGEEMHLLLKERVLNSPDVELRIAAGEQAKITRLRLEKLLQET